MYCVICERNFSVNDRHAICMPCHAIDLAKAKVPAAPTWADKALRAFRNAINPSPGTNYVADREVHPSKVVFANGRTVEIVNGALEVGWAEAVPRGGDHS